MTKFLTSKLSGYIAIGLLVALVAGGFYIYRQGITLGELKQAAATLDAMKREQAERQKALSKQADQLAKGRKEADELREQLRQAEKMANEAFAECMAMPVPDGMRIRVER